MTFVSPLSGLVTRMSRLIGTSASIELDPEAVVTRIEDANIVTSEVADRPGFHKVALDIDMPCKVVESTTPGHFHLYIDKELSWEDYQRLIWVMADLGLVEEGYASASHVRKYTALRLPWVKKEKVPPHNPRGYAACRCLNCRADRAAAANPW